VASFTVCMSAVCGDVQEIRCGVSDGWIRQYLSGLGRVQQIELLHGYADMKMELLEYLKKFTENHKVVREEDIAEFFTQLQARKRQRTESPPSQNYTE